MGSRFDPRLRHRDGVKAPSLDPLWMADARLTGLMEGLRPTFPVKITSLIRFGKKPPRDTKVYRVEMARYVPEDDTIEVCALLSVPECPNDVLEAVVFLGMLLAYSGRRDAFEIERFATWIDENMHLCRSAEFLALFIDRFWTWLPKVSEISRSDAPRPSRSLPVASES